MDAQFTIQSEADALCERGAAQYEKRDRGRPSAERPADLRQLDTIDPGYRA
jgi:hypothetical protein